MKSLIFIFSLVSILTFASSCSIFQKKPVISESWKHNMDQLGETLTSLYPYVVSDKKFNNPDNESLIYEKTQQIARLAVQMKTEHDFGKIRQYDRDPTVRTLVNTFEKEMLTSVDALRNGDRSYARATLRNVTALCLQCHTRGNWGAQLTGQMTSGAATDLSAFEKAELLASLRNYDEALKIYTSIIDTPERRDIDPIEWSRAAKSALNIAVRVKQDPDLALSVVQKIESSANTSQVLRAAAGPWRDFIAAWKKDERNPVTKTALINDATRLIRKARSQEGFFSNTATYIYYLRASGILHDYLRTQPQGVKEATALSLLGQCYERIQSDQTSNFNELFYKQCIFAAPHTEVATHCYERFEESLFIRNLNTGQGSGFPALMDYMDYLKREAYPAQ